VRVREGILSSARTNALGHIDFRKRFFLAYRIQLSGFLRTPNNIERRRMPWSTDASTSEILAEFIPASLFFRVLFLHGVTMNPLSMMFFLDGVFKSTNLCYLLR
jgi:hypothetical protein